MDKEARKALIERYLEAETSPKEEKTLREWYANHPVDEDEWAEAMLLNLDNIEAEFDQILAAGERNRRRRILRRASLFGCALAASVALLFWLVPTRQTSGKTLTPTQIAEGIQQMMQLDIGGIESIEAVPKGSYAVLTARLSDGSTCSYILTYNDEGATSLLADSNR